MINSFANYLKIGKVKRKTPDTEEAKALFVQSQERLEYACSKNITEKNARFILQDSYESAREAAQSLMSFNGFKPYSHEATISFIRDFYKSNFNEEEISKFDQFRELRNNSVYKAILIVEEDAKSCLLFARKFVAKVELILKEKPSLGYLFNS